LHKPLAIFFTFWIFMGPPLHGFNGYHCLPARPDAWKVRAGEFII